MSSNKSSTGALDARLACALPGTATRVGAGPDFCRPRSQPAYPGALAAADVAQRLGEAAAGPAHQFWPDDVNLLQAGSVDWQRVLGHRQVTDVYQLALAVHHHGRLVTFDRSLALAAVLGASAGHLAVIA